MKEEIKEYLEKSNRSFNVAKELLRQGHSDFAASRAYYSLFYSVEALLLTKELSFSKHKGVIAAFGEHFIKTGIFPTDYHRLLQKAFDLRMLGDYGAELVSIEEDVNSLIIKAEEMLQAIKLYLGEK